MKTTDDKRILAAIQPDTEPKPAAWQWRAMENSQPRTGWHMAGTNDHAGWAELARRDATCSIEDRPLYATPSSAGMVSVEAAAKVLMAAQEAYFDGEGGSDALGSLDTEALRALAGDKS